MPFDAQNEGALIRKIIRGAYQPVNAPVSPALVQLVDMMMTFDQRRRPDSTALLNHAVVKMRVGRCSCCAECILRRWCTLCPCSEWCHVCCSRVLCMLLAGSIGRTLTHLGHAASLAMYKRNIIRMLR
jgi:hypothetical protein